MSKQNCPNQKSNPDSYKTIIFYIFPRKKHLAFLFASNPKKFTIYFIGNKIATER